MGIPDNDDKIYSPSSIFKFMSCPIALWPVTLIFFLFINLETHGIEIIAVLEISCTRWRFNGKAHTRRTNIPSLSIIMFKQHGCMRVFRG